MDFVSIMHVITRAIEAVGVAVIVIGIAIAGLAYLKAPGTLDAYSRLRAAPSIRGGPLSFPSRFRPERT